MALLRGGTLRGLAFSPIRGRGAILVALLMQLPVMYLPAEKASGHLNLERGLLLLSYFLILSIFWMNRRLPGFRAIGLGFLLNLTVMMANGGYMPIQPAVLESFGHQHMATRMESGYRVLHSKDVLLTREETRLWILSDVFAFDLPLLPPMAFSPGDVLIAVGAFVFIQSIMLPSRETRPVAPPPHTLSNAQANSESSEHDVNG
jgi:hypothetical protein